MGDRARKPVQDILNWPWTWLKFGSILSIEDFLPIKWNDQATCQAASCFKFRD